MAPRRKGVGASTPEAVCVAAGASVLLMLAYPAILVAAQTVGTHERIGCYQDHGFDFKVEMAALVEGGNASAFTADACANACEGYIYFALKPRGQCGCVSCWECSFGAGRAWVCFFRGYSQNK